ncbi:MAG: hypothetical protein CM15mP120_29230 [Pseudomonadota bacterium]|nr:MAG: hypothetical protein CM15mP120_29230 [Pseudomonadota bacterium]
MPLSPFCCSFLAWLAATILQQKIAPPLTEAVAIDYIGSAACAGCHQEAWQHWQQSHHQLAMAPADRLLCSPILPMLSCASACAPVAFKLRGTNYVVSLPHEPAGLQK